MQLWDWLRSRGVPVRPLRVPTRLQFQTTECGVAALAMVLAHFGRPVALEELRARTGVSRDCVNAAEIARAARHYGLECRAHSLEPGALSVLPLPLLVHLQFVHFVVVEGFTSTHVLVNDPGHGRARIARERFFEIFTGVVLSFAGSKVSPVQDRPTGAWTAFLRRSGASLRRGMLAALGAGVASAGLAVAAVLALGHAVDAGRGMAVFTAAALAVAAVGLLGAQASGLARLQGALADRHRLLLARHLTRLPPGFFLYRLPSRLADLLGSPEAAAEDLVQMLTGATRLAATPLAAGALLWLHPAAGAVFAGTLGLGVLALLAVLHLWGDANRGHSRHAPEGGEPAPLSIAALEQHRLAGRARELASSWLGQQAGRHQNEVRSAQLEARLDAIAAGCSALGFAAVMGVLVMAGASAGTALAAALLALMAGAALGELAPAFLLRHRLDALLQPMADVLATPTAGADPPADPGPPPDALPAGLALRASDVRFGYSATRAPLIDGIDLELRAGEQLGLTGPSGGGKSTVAAVLAGRLPPWSGHVQRTTSDGRARPVGWVDRSAFFFEGSVRENLCLWREVAPQRLAAAVRDAELEAVLAARPGGVDTPLEAGGLNFSGGQRQRLEIARALVNDPAVLVLDEALDGLDPATELRIRQNLRRRGCALVIVSHRAFTLAQCDRVLRVAGGRLSTAPPDAAAAAPPPVQGQASPAPSAEDPAAAMATATPQAVAQAVACIARHLGATPDDRIVAAGTPASESASESAEVLRCAQAAGLLPRVLRLVGTTEWAQVAGPVLAFGRDDGQPVVVLPGGRLRDPATGRSRPLRDAAAELRTGAWGFLPVRPAAASTHALLRSVRGDLRAEALRGAAAALLAAAPALLLTLWALRLAASDGATGITLAFAAVCTGLACALGAQVRSAAAARLTLTLQRLGMARLALHVACLDLQALRPWTRIELARRLQALPRALRRLGGRPLQALLDLPTLALCLALLAWWSPITAVAGAVVAAAAMALPLALGQAAARIEPLREHRGAATSRLLTELLGGTERLRLLGRYRFAMRHWMARRRQWSREGVAVRALHARLLLLPDAAPALAVMAVVPLAIAGGIPRHPLAAAGVLAWLLARASLNFGIGLSAGARSRPVIADADTLLAVPQAASGPPLPSPWHLRLQDMAFAYPGSPRPALHALSLDVRSGEQLAITGPSGSGKSTLLRVLLGLQAPDAGTITLNGQPVDAAHWASLRDATARVAQEARLELTQTLRAQIADGSGASLADVRRAVEDVCMGNDIAALPMGLQTIAEHGRLSSGQEQRLLIARELVRHPRLLILDEATNAIEESVQAEMLARLRRRGIACILVTHRESALRAMDRVVVLREGSVVWQGPPAQLDAAPDIRAMLRAEQQSGHA